MHEALLLRDPENLHYLVIGSITGILVGLHQVLRHVADSQAHIVLDIANALSAHCLLAAAGTYIHCVLVIFCQPVRKLLHADRAALVFDGLLYRDDVHAQAAAALGYETGDLAYRYTGGIVEEGGNLRMLGQQSRIHHHVLTGANDPLGNKILPGMIRSLPVKLHQSDLRDVVGDLLRLLHAHVVALCQLLDAHLVDSLLLEGKHKTDFLLVQQAVQQPVVREGRIHILRLVDLDVIRDHAGQLLYELVLLRVLDGEALIEEVVLIEHIMLKLFGYHTAHITPFKSSVLLMQRRSPGK